MSDIVLQRPVTLVDCSEWDLWIYNIMEAAKIYEFWDYIDPTIPQAQLPEPLASLTSPVEPPHVPETSEDKEQNLFLWRSWEAKLRLYNHYKFCVYVFRYILYQTVHVRNLPLLYHADTIREKIAILKNNFGPREGWFHNKYMDVGSPCQNDTQAEPHPVKTTPNPGMTYSSATPSPATFSQVTPSTEKTCSPVTASSTTPSLATLSL